MLEMHGDEEERHQNQVLPADLESAAKLHVAHHAARDPDEHAEDIGKHDAVHRVHAEIRERREDFGGVMNLVEIPQHRDPMAQIVIDPVAQFVGEEQKHGHDRLAGELVQSRLGNDTEDAGQRIAHQMTDESRGDHRPPKQQTGGEDVEQQKADVRPEGSSSQPPRKQGPAYHSERDALLFRTVPDEKEDDRNTQRADQRGCRKAGPEPEKQHLEFLDDELDQAISRVSIHQTLCRSAFSQQDGRGVREVCRRSPAVAKWL